MDIKENDLGDLLNRVSSNLRDYLIKQGVNIRDDGFHSCISPSHPDHNPSASIGGNAEFAGKVTHCFSCKKSFNIFHAANIFEKKPLSGMGFFQDTLPHLCKMYDIPYEPIQISEDQKREYERRRAYQDAVNICHSNMFAKGNLRDDHTAIKNLSKRGITLEAIRKFKIGCIDSHISYMKEMESLGWDNKEWLYSCDLANKQIFTKDGIIIPIYDDRDRPVGFVTRTTKELTDDQPKFVNSVNSDIYHKSEILFNFNNFESDKGALYIVEGYLDAVYLTQAGIPNVVALGSTTLTEDHINLLLKYNVRTIYLIFDGDDGGKRGTELAIERLAPYCSNNKGRMRAMIYELEANKDPDDLVSEIGSEEFIKRCRNDSVTPFAWTLKKATFQDDPLAVAQKAIPIIAAEESPILRTRMIKDLASITNVSEEDIKKEVELKLDISVGAFVEELTDINKTVQIQLNKRKVGDTKSILEDALLRIKKSEQLHNKKIDNQTDFVEKIGEIRHRIEEGSYVQGIMPAKFAKLCDKIDGIPYWTNLTLVGGRPSSGKTTFLTALAIDMIDSDEEAAVCYMSIDDTTEIMTLKILAMKSGLPTSMIKKYNTLSPEDKKKVDEAWNWINSVSNRFIIVDANKGNSVDALESHVDWFTRNCKQKKKVFLLDNFHKLRSSVASRNGKKAEAVSDTSEKVKDLTQLNDLHIIATVELRKLDGTDARPTLADLKDSVQLEYDADVILLVHNDLQARKQESNISWVDTNNGTINPYIEIQLEKNKLTGISDKLAYKLNSVNLRVIEDSWATIARLLEKKKKVIRSNNDQTF